MADECGNTSIKQLLAQDSHEVCPNRIGSMRGIRKCSESLTYEKGWYGTVQRQRVFTTERMKTNIAGMLANGREILTRTPHSAQVGDGRPFAKPDIVTISFQKP
jgi:hypothetical protein